ncbi:MAG TPA: hypothetical protein VHX37_09620 [Acidobacteriaceae bacterium]|nr:hypothetical protein [Acidobacteriaceae bacterium]
MASSLYSSALHVTAQALTRPSAGRAMRFLWGTASSWLINPGDY